MNKKILLSFVTIGVVLASVGGATRALFSDTETSTGNTFSTGTIDISVDGNNPWEDSEQYALTDMKPSYTDYINLTIKNVGKNPANIWKDLGNIVTSEGTQSEPECDYYGVDWDADGEKCVEGDGTEFEGKNDIQYYINYDLRVEVYDESDDMVWWQTIYLDEDEVTVADVAGMDKGVYLGMLPVGYTMEVSQSYHMRGDTDNWAQGDEMTFDMELYAEQLTNTITLENKKEVDGDLAWLDHDDVFGTLTHTVRGPEFDYSFEGYGLDSNTEYCLIYYSDPWTGDEGTEIACGSTASGETDLSLSGSPNLGMNIPTIGDDNYPGGGKIWLVLADDYEGGKMVGWDPDSYLFETGLIQYEDTDL